ncbi:hypothetical protein [Snodgrassella alvi]|uniref:hypothetical protein n=1 Tax=Snodgrassella alvi TaxID=1196083 RepID=UPI000C1EC05E|nr:hypothetical protein [Snodgrassella alvi]
MALKNLYEILNVPFTATTEDIRKAIKHCAETQTVELADLQLCVKTLLNDEARKAYNIEYFKEYPKSLEEFLDGGGKPIKEKNADNNVARSANKVVKKTSNSRVNINPIALGILTIFFLYSACSESSEEKERKKRIVDQQQKEYILNSRAQENVKMVLKDPDSATFRNMVGSCGEVNSKNGFGAYTGFKRFMAPDPAITVIEDEGQMDAEEFNKAWASCAKAEY